jgi:hypothetical protein
MAQGSNSVMKIIGIVLVVLGLGLAYWGYQLSGSVESQLTQAFTGSDTDRVMTFYIGGAVSFVVGLFLAVKK